MLLRLLCVVSVGLFTISCSSSPEVKEPLPDFGSGQQSSSTTSSSTATPTTTPTTMPTTSTSSSASSTSSSLPDTMPSFTTTSAVPVSRQLSGVFHPLTGLSPDGGQDLSPRPALVVKIPNNSKAHPQTGLNSTDLVFEYRISDSVTRFAAVFQSSDAPGSESLVGPIRSGRIQDIDLVSNLSTPLFAWSGGNPSVNEAIGNANLVDLSYTGGFSNLYERRSGRGGAPHNLFSSTAALWSASSSVSPPAPVFDFLDPQFLFEGPAFSSFSVLFGSQNVSWLFDQESSLLLRSEDGSPHPTENSGQVAADTVLVFEVVYQPSPADARSPAAQTVGSGRAHIFHDGVYQTGFWSRSSGSDSWNLFTDESLTEQLLVPAGRMWVELVDAGSPIQVS